MPRRGQRVRGVSPAPLPPVATGICSGGGGEGEWIVLGRKANLKELLESKELAT